MIFDVYRLIERIDCRHQQERMMENDRLRCSSTKNLSSTKKLAERSTASHRGRNRQIQGGSKRLILDILFSFRRGRSCRVLLDFEDSEDESAFVECIGDLTGTTPRMLLSDDGESYEIHYS